MPDDRPDAVPAAARDRVGRLAMRAVGRLVTFTSEREAGTATLLFLYLFLVLGALLVLKPVGSALFLDAVGAKDLPILYVLVAAVSGVVALGYGRLAGRLSIDRLVFGTNIVLIGCLVAFYLIFSSKFTPQGLYYAFYVWVNLFGILTSTQFWLLANEAFTPRQAKRLFGFVGAGGILGGIVGGWLAKFLAETVGAESLLLLCAGALFGCIALLSRLRLRRPLVVGARRRGPAPGPAVPGWKLVAGSPYLRLIGGLIFIGVVVVALAEYELSALAAATFEGREELTAFLGSYYATLNLVSLVIQLVVTGRLIRRFGVGWALALQPLALLMGGVVLLASPVLWAAMVFKGADGAFKHSVNRSASELLYLPLPMEIKGRAKTFIDIFVTRLGEGAGGLVLLGITVVYPLSVRSVTAVALGFSLIWLFIAWKLRGAYTEAFRAVLADHEGPAPADPLSTGEPLTRAALVAALTSEDEIQVGRALTILERLGDNLRLFTPQLALLLGHDAPAVRSRALDVLRLARAIRLLPAVRPLLIDPAQPVRAAAARFLAVHDHDAAIAGLGAAIDPLLTDDDPDVRTAGIALAARDPAHLDSARAALVGLIGDDSLSARLAATDAFLLLLPESPLRELLPTLLIDHDPRVVRAAIDAVGSGSDPRYLPLLISLLGLRPFRRGAVRALRCYEADALVPLRAALLDERLTVAHRLEIPKVLERIGSRAAADLLLGAVPPLERSRLRQGAIRGLNRLREHHPEVTLDGRRVERALLYEARQLFLHSTRLAPVAAGQGRDSLPAVALREHMDGARERMSRLLGLIYPARDILNAYRAAQSRQAFVRESALEYFDALLPEGGIRSVMLPLLADDSGAQALARAAEHLFGFPQLTLDEALLDLARSGEPWLRIVAAKAAAAAGLSPPPVEALDPTAASDRLLASLTAELVALTELDPARFTADAFPEPALLTVARWAARTVRARPDLTEGAMSTTAADRPPMTLLERVAFLRRVPLFSRISTENLADIGQIAEEVEYRAGTVLVGEGDAVAGLWIVVSGALELEGAQTDRPATVRPSESFGELLVIDRDPSPVTVVVAEGGARTLLLRADAVADLLEDQFDLVQAIFRALSRASKP